MSQEFNGFNGIGKNRKFLAACRDLLELPIVTVDVGADGGVREWGELAAICEIHAFEPRSDSVAELQESQLDIVQPRLKLHGTALARTTGRHRLYVTRTPQASSLRKPIPASFLVKRWRQDNGFEIAQELEVDCITLGQFAQEQKLTGIDLLKLDTQGTELDILRGGGEFLHKISVIKSEVEFVQLYEGQPLFDEMVGTLASYGFRFFAFEEGAEVFRKKIWSDCMFIQSRFTDKARMMRAAAILIHMGYFEEALWLLIEHGVPVEIHQRLVDARMDDITPAFVKLWKGYKSTVRKSLKAIGLFEAAKMVYRRVSRPR